MDKGLGWGEGFSWPGDLLTRLHEEVDTSVFFPLQALHTNLVLRHPEPPDAPVCGPHQIYVNPTIDSSERPRVGLPLLCCKLTVYPFQGSHRLHTQ